ncbi:phosphoenolpyruvate carboxylase [Parafilimonas sp.]|uniref:phosphoenolpyruvate carboxylase n=1 Tax=Parafilimonas sp. TaxID=1969739 RepID=UPI0039E715A6
MSSTSSAALQEFKSLVALKFQLYNSLFTSLPFHRIEKTGVLLSLFLLECEEGFSREQSPAEIIDRFLQKNTPYDKEEEWIDLLFRFVQYAERQVVLFDAIEDAAFTHVNDVNGPGTIKQLCSQITQMQKDDAFVKKLNDFAVRIVLTAHPTQFYTGEVLGIINDLNSALQTDDTEAINNYLQQLGRTPFLKKQKPTPYDEAVSLLWFLENVFYDAAGNIMSILKNDLQEFERITHPLIQMGFWPGADRDGNPFVTTDITLKVAETLRFGILRSYHKNARWLKRRLTFKGTQELITLLEKRLYDNLYGGADAEQITQEEIKHILLQIIDALHANNDLFIQDVYKLLFKSEIFGLYFASLDIRQESTVHSKFFEALAAQKILSQGYAGFDESKKIEALLKLHEQAVSFSDNELFNDTIKSVKAVKTIQERNGKKACHRYVISQCNSALNVIEVYALFLLGGWKKEALSVDIVPLFETIDDLANASAIMKRLYSNKTYRQHVKLRNNTQTIMLGFSDGTKDGGYLMANWSIYKAKEELTSISKSFGIDVIFFDGRGGPPARGGGKTHKFYASMGHDISNKEIQLTVQGQTVSSNFGTISSAQFNIEQLIHAGIANDLFSSKENTLTRSEERLLKQLSEDSYEAYIQLKNHPAFVDYLAEISPLRFYSETNIGSRPAKRGKTTSLSLKDLRAIPFVGSFSQLKQNVTGYYGVGTALKKAEAYRKWSSIEQLYKHSLFFRTLIDNCEMAMMKCYFPLTQYLSNNPRYGKLWNMMYSEYKLTLQYLQKLTGNDALMAGYPVESSSIHMRERIVLPLATIQQYALMQLRAKDKLAFKEKYEKLAMRCSFGIINAGRNSA